jgi:hypothetical protein
MAARTFHATDVQLLKLVHNQLPTRHHLSKFQPWVNPKCHHCDDPETFDHLQQSACNQVSQRYYSDISNSLNEYFDKHDTPRDFRVSFLHGLEQWLQHSSEDAPVDCDHEPYPWRGTPKLLRSQQEIGWRLLTRGFLSVHWRNLLIKTRHQERWSAKLADHYPDFGEEEDDTITAEFDPEWTLTDQDINDAPSNEDSLEDMADFFVDFNSDDSKPPTSEAYRRQDTDPTIFLTGITKILWAEMSTLWRSHLEYNHKTAETKNSPVTLQDNRTQVRALHNLGNQVQEPNRTSYFHDNVDDFLEKSTAQQLGQYIALYEPVIMASISRRRGQSHQSQPQQPADHSIHPSTSRHSKTNNGENNRLLTHPALEEAPHRKRTRIRRQVEHRVQNPTMATRSPSSDPETIS